MDNRPLLVRSHTARDLIQSAGLFKTARLVVWEYVSNGLQYIDEGTVPSVMVVLDNRNKRISIRDNGRGMDWTGLDNFFVMHGENIDRASGRPGRGRFGTGKSAAFGIAGTLRITTVRNGKISKVELRKRDIEEMRSGDGVPVSVLSREQPSPEPNGTLVEIDDVYIRSIDNAEIIGYIERHLSRWPNASVIVNNHECELAEPPVYRTVVYRPQGDLAGVLGDVELTLKVSSLPVEAELNGVAVFSKGVWHETTLAGCDNKEMVRHIFGDIDVPCLDEDTSPISPFDMSRSMQLNVNNPTVLALHAFIGERIDALRKELIAEERHRRTSEEAKRLAEQANEIASVINADFSDYKRRVARVRARSGVGSDHVSTVTDDLGEIPVFVSGNDTLAKKIGTIETGDKRGETRSIAKDPHEAAPLYTPDPTNDELAARPASGAETDKRPRGGFQVKFERMGGQSHRAQYTRNERTIYVNLDHPQLVAALGSGSVEEALFRRLSYEIAFSEYSIALASELAGRDEYIDPIDPIVDIRDTINRLARRAAALYSN